MNSSIEFSKKNPDKFMTRNDYPLYIRLCQNLKDKYNYSEYTKKIVFSVILRAYCKLLNIDTFSHNLMVSSHFILIHLPKIISIILILIDCVYNNYQIHLIFYYLPFYFVFHLWQSCTSFLEKTSNSLNNIIYERYYEGHNVKYIDTTDEEDDFIFRYIERGCKCFTHDIKDKDFEAKWEKFELFSSFPQIFIHNRKYVRVNDTNIFKNYYTGDEALEENLTEAPLK